MICLHIQVAVDYLLYHLYYVADAFTPYDLNIQNNSLLPSPGFEETAGFVLPVLGHSEQLLQPRHGFLHRRMRGQAHSLVNEPPHGLQSQGGGLSAGLLHSF